ARAATLFELALPGSAYLYQGEELGLHEVAEIPDEQRQDPAFWRTTAEDRGFDGLGRDGCRVPLPWTREGSSFGFGDNGAHLPQPAWFADFSVEAEDGVAGSTLELYRAALRLRAELQGEETLAWDEQLSGGDVLAFARPGGWLSVTNFGAEPVTLPDGEVLLSSSPLEATDDGGLALPGATTVWLRRAACAAEPDAPRSPPSAVEPGRSRCGLAVVPVRSPCGGSASTRTPCCSAPARSLPACGSWMPSSRSASSRAGIRRVRGALPS